MQHSSLSQTGGANRATGWVLAVIGVLVLTPDTLIIRLVGENPWTFLVWRGLFMAIGFMIFLILKYRLSVFRKFYEVGALGLLTTLPFALGNFCFQVSLDHTSVANTLVILATSPLFAAIIGWIFLREMPNIETWIAVLVAMIGIGYIFQGNIDWTRFSTDGIYGDILAFGASIGLAIHFVILRAARPTDMLPALVLAGLVMCGLSFFLAPTLYLPPESFLMVAGLGLVILPVSFGCLAFATHHISAAEVSLILLLETVLGPIWVWLVIFEEPPAETLVGGSVVVAALIGHSIAGLTRDRMRSRRNLKIA